MKRTGSIELHSGTLGLSYKTQTVAKNNDLVDLTISRCQNGIWKFTIEKETNKSFFINGFWEDKRNYREYYNKYDDWIKLYKINTDIKEILVIYDIKKEIIMKDSIQTYKNKFGFFDWGFFVAIDFPNAFLKNMYFYTDEDDVIYGFDIMVARKF